MRVNKNKKIEVVVNNTAREINVSNVSELRGLLSAARSTGEPVAIIKIPARLMAIDKRYQTELRTERDLGYLINNWDERKLLPLTVVPHDEEGLVYITDGQEDGKQVSLLTLKNMNIFGVK